MTKPDTLNHSVNKRRNRRPLLYRIILGVLGLGVVVSLSVAFLLYLYIYAPNVDTGGKRQAELFIPTGSTYASVADSLESILVNKRSFHWLAEKKSYPGLVRPGRYIVNEGMSNLHLVNMLRAGRQVPVMVTFNNIRTVEQLARTISNQIEADSAGIASLLNDEAFLDEYGLDRYTALSMFIPNTYEFFWNTSARQFIERMSIESDRFWEGEREQMAQQTSLSRMEIITLASIVDKETNKNDEKARIAGVYMNRLIKGWPLQADPTVVYATGDFEAKRVLNKHTRIDSPYNTYRRKGLPPGPICIPSIASIDAVLNFEKHNYMFFVASEDLSGYHVFSKTLSEHNKHARRYRQAVKDAQKNG